VTSRFVEANGVRLHYLDHGGDGPTLVLTHGLSANAHSLDVLARLLAPALHVLAFDLRGRGLSDKPETGYSMADHAADLLGALDALGLGPVVLGGHSFGGLLTLYVAATAPDRVERAIVLDVPDEVDRRVLDQIAPSLSRLDQTYPSADAFLEFAKSLPYFEGNAWDDDIAAWYCSELEELADGSVRPRVRSEHIRQCVEATFEHDWGQLASSVECPILIVRSRDPFGAPGSPPIMSAEGATRLLSQLRNGRVVEVPGNHITFVFGNHAAITASAMLEFTRDDAHLDDKSRADSRPVSNS
jgi:pimeloyl-ACP methyl ester carboxylesterase